MKTKYIIDIKCIESERRTLRIPVQSKNDMLSFGAEDIDSQEYVDSNGNYRSIGISNKVSEELGIIIGCYASQNLKIRQLKEECCRMEKTIQDLTNDNQNFKKIVETPNNTSFFEKLKFLFKFNKEKTT